MRKLIETNYDLIKGTRNAIERDLMMIHGKPYVNPLMRKIDLIIELSTEMGIEIGETDKGNEIRENLIKARKQRLEL